MENLIKHRVLMLVFSILIAGFFVSSTPAFARKTSACSGISDYVKRQACLKKQSAVKRETSSSRVQKKYAQKPGLSKKYVQQQSKKKTKYQNYSKKRPKKNYYR